MSLEPATYRKSSLFDLLLHCDPKIRQEPQDPWRSILHRSQDTEQMLTWNHHSLRAQMLCALTELSVILRTRIHTNHGNLKNKIMTTISVYGHHKHCLGSISNIQNLQLPTIKTFHIHLRGTSLNLTKCTFSFFFQTRGGKEKAKLSYWSQKCKVLKLVDTCELWTSDWNLDRLESWIISIYRHKQTPSRKSESKKKKKKNCNCDRIEVIFYLNTSSSSSRNYLTLINRRMQKHT